MSVAAPPQELVERALAASTADGQVTFVTESSEANLRWAANSLTTNGAMRSRQVVVVSFVDGGAGMAAGTVARTGTPDVAELVAASEQAARDAGPAEDAVPLVSEAPAGRRRLGRRAGRDLDRGVRRVRARRWARRSARRATATSCCSASPSTRWRTTYLGTLDRAAAAARPAHRPGRAQRQEPRLLAARCGPARAPATSATSRSPTSPPTSQRKMGWSQRRIELPAGRYETLLPPSAVSDLMIYLYWTMEARDADEGRNVFARPGGGNRIGERLAALPLTLRSDPAAPGLETAPFQVVGASSGSRVGVRQRHGRRRR